MTGKLLLIRPKRQLPRPPGGIFRRSFRVGRYTVTVRYDLDAIAPGVAGVSAVQWSPDDVPPKLSSGQFRLYRKRRNAVFQEIADIIGGNVAVANL